MRFDAADITAAILAGGEGRRLGGCDKGLALLAGKPLVAHVVAALRQQVGKVLLCIHRNAERYEAFAPTCIDHAVEFRGPLAGIASALAACETTWLLTAPVDCPLPPTELAERLYAHTGDARVVVAHDGSRRQPLFALYRHELAASAESALAHDLPVWRWQDELGAVEVDFSGNPQAFLNLNTDADFRDWEKSHE